jgi:hypothetical protein
MTDIHSTPISTTPISTTSLPDGFRSRLRRNAGLAATAGAGLTLIWALTGGGAFWPLWAWLGLGGAVAADAGLRFAMRRSAGRPRPIAVITAGAGVLLAVEIALWAFTGGGYFWPMWTALLLGGAALVARIVAVPAPAHR